MNNRETPYPDPKYAWYVVAILFLAYTVSFVDRMIISLLVEPIKQDLEISDFRISLLHGAAFTLFYTVLGIPLGRLADKKNRKAIISTGVFLWSIMTAVCGLAKSFWSLFAARIGVGVGEACLSPSAYSMISDYFPKEKRGLAISLYSMGIFFGIGVANIAGGIVVQYASQAGEIVLPMVGEIRPWQLTFFIVGIPGLIVVALMSTVKEPQRREMAPVNSGHNHMTIGETISYLLTRWKAYSTHIFGFSLTAMLSYGFFSWVPTMYVRTFDWTIPEISRIFGIIILVFGTTGIIFGNYLSDRLMAKGQKDGYFRVAIIGMLGITFFGVVAMSTADPVMTLVLLCPTIFCLGFPVGIGPAAINYISPNQLRGQGIAIFYFVLNILGLGLGPAIVAFFTDFVFEDEALLRYSIAAFTFIVGVTGIAILWAGMRPYRECVEEFHGSSN